MIRIQLHTKTQIKLTHVDDFLTFSPNKSLCMNNFSGVRNLLVSLHFINTVVFRHTIRFNFLQNRLCNSTRMLHDFVFLEHAADADSEKFYLKKLEEFNKIAKELTKHIRKKHDITIYSHLDIKFF